MLTKSATKKVKLFGSTGRMGQAIAQLVSEDEALELCTSCEEADVLIDFSSSAITLDVLASAQKWQKPLVMGTTGLSEEQMQHLVEASKKIPILYSANFSIGIALMMRLLNAIKDEPYFSSIKIIDTHHVHKKDAPSGTALRLKEALGDAVQIESIREGEVIGRHEVVFEMEDEALVIKHEAFSRILFGRGALLAAKFIIKKPPGLYNINDVC